ncbi:MAG: hypothetical protein FWG93_01920 [Oscillospiraceae bacterium]|nr:hypothetical protein [Oscillospiraceae bacterium]
MSRGKITVLSVTITLLMVGALLTSFFLSGWAGRDRPPIELPPKDAQTGRPDGDIPRPMISFPPYRPLGFDPATAPQVIETLSRSRAYLCDIRVQWLWAGGGVSRTYRLAVRGDLYGVMEFSGDVDLSGPVLPTPDYYYLMNPERQLRWTSQARGDMIGVIYEGARGTESADELCSVPTYENLLNLPEGAITYIDYETGEQGRFLVVNTREKLYIGHYLLSEETGLLHQAFFYDIDDPDPTRPVYCMEMTAYREGDPGDGYFTQPEGTVKITGR